MDFDSIYTSYFRDVYFYIYGIARNESLAEEITQETFVKALKAINSFDGGKDIRAWLFTIARNTFYTCCKRQKIYAEQSFDENIDAEEPYLVNRITDEETAFLIHQFLHDMSEPYKEVFTLRVFGELSYEWIGMLFGKSAGWARVTFYRAKRQINDYLENCKREFEKLSQNAVIADNAAVRLKEAEPLRFLKKRIQRIRAFAVSALLVLILLMTVPLPVRINRTIGGICWENGNTQTAEECQVTVKGWYYRYLLKDNILKGDISFTTAEGTVSYDVPGAAISRGAMYQDRGGSVTVYDGTQNRMRSLGYVAVTGNFKEIFIHSEEWNFSAPARDCSEALELADQLTTGEWY